MKNILFIIAFTLAGFSYAQNQQEKTAVTKFKTSAICNDCRERIEKELNYTKGVVYSELDLDTKVLTVKYKTKFQNTEKLKYLVAKIGYDAGETPRDKDAFEALPKCCKSEGHCAR